MAAYFTPDGDTLLPSAAVRGPWGENTMNGQMVGALLARAAERAGAGDGFRGARLTVDLIRMATLDPVTWTTTVLREGRRVRLVDAELVQRDRVVARCRALFVRSAPHPTGTIWSATSSMPPPPGDDEWPAGGRKIKAYAADRAGHADVTVWSDGSHPKQAWLRLDTDLVEGEPMSGFVRAGLAGDTTSPLTHFGSAGLAFINADFTVDLAREPVGPLIGLESRDHQGFDGVGVGAVTMYDATGPVGSCVATALASEVELRIPD